MPNLGFVDQVADQVTANPGAGMQPPPSWPREPAACYPTVHAGFEPDSPRLAP